VSGAYWNCDGFKAVLPVIFQNEILWSIICTNSVDFKMTFPKNVSSVCDMVNLLEYQYLARKSVYI
jgi:hypothetical protein